MRRSSDKSAVAQRLVQTRLALGLPTQRALADEIGIHSHQINVLERGHRRIAVGVALLIYKRFGVSLDWIYCGDPTGLPASLYNKLKGK